MLLEISYFIYHLDFGKSNTIISLPHIDKGDLAKVTFLWSHLESCDAGFCPDSINYPIVFISYYMHLFSYRLNHMFIFHL